MLKKFQIKYVFEAFEIRSNFHYRNILIFEVEFELKKQGICRI
jgi:hypothetical protein